MFFLVMELIFWLLLGKTFDINKLSYMQLLLGSKRSFYDVCMQSLDERTKAFSKKVRLFIRMIPVSKYLQEDIDQLVRSAGSVGANYIEAKDAFTTKDFVYRIKICRKESHESHYWLDMIHDHVPDDTRKICADLLKESDELARIFTAIAKKCERKR